MDNILDNLNDVQKEAVIYNDGPSLIIAGAGSGKTRVLTRKVAYLLSQGLAPWSIMALTFTNKAAREMKERIAAMIDGKSASRLWMGTFHSIFLRILRAESAALGFPSDFSIYDTADTKSLIRSILKEMQLDEKVYKPNVVCHRISIAKNAMITPSDYADTIDYQQRDNDSRMPRITQVYARYAERCRRANAMDFDDILLYTNILFRDHPEILAAYQERFQFVLVDEYQDTNSAQHLIVKQLAAKHHKVCVVGDDSQSIYSFRGADIENILQFQRTYPECRLFKLEQNYRSTQNIVNIANSLIQKNKNQIKKQVFSKRECGSLIRIVSAFSDVEEAYMVAGKISEQRIRSHDSWEDFAILYRTNAQSRLLEEAMRKRNIPYRIYGGLSFYQHKEVKDVIAYMRMAVNPADEESFKRIINYPARGIGDTTLGKLQSLAAEQQLPLWNILLAPEQFNLPVNSGTLKKLTAFRDIILHLQSRVTECTAYEFTEELLVCSGIQADLALDSTPEGITRKENIQSLMGGIHDFCQERLEEGEESILVTDFLSEVSLLTDQDDSGKEGGERVTLMTVHAAKGLEFNNVYITGLEENLFPSQRTVESESEIEEERRLLYVAITRAKDNCCLLYAKSRFRNGQTEYSRPSRFLYDMDRSLMDLPARPAPTPTPTENAAFGDRKAYPSRSGYGNQSHSPSERTYYSPNTGHAVSENTSRPASGPRKLTRLTTTGSGASQGSQHVQTMKGAFRVGQRVLHERFGEGVIERIEGEGDNCKIGVQFTHAGFKLLLIKYASMKALD